ncbi:type II secretion system F family protein [Streptomyces pinistramenti]|uniref:type II secretion system F family protein n=1 Tax=Streptomyces pinistramenti TaxID=2884812 RepID=UPI001D08B720|nr:type II secretion system F family protein [Streptomyces pinistramenti]MCB5912043.1 type II secretion system F family protein [Streptomyces pinistramenti]
MSPEVVHRLGMAGVAVVVVSAVWCARSPLLETHRRRRVRRRAAAVLGRSPAVRGIGTGRGRSGAESGRRRGGLRLSGRVKEWLGPLGVAGFVAILVGGTAGVVAGPVAAYGAYLWRRRQRATETERRAQAAVREELAPAGDLLAACLAAGAGPRESAEAVGRSLGGIVGERLRQVAAELRLGGEPANVWPRLAALPGAAELARCMERAGISGVPAVDAVSRIAAELRAEWGRAAAGRARRAGVLVTLPLAACFLPAFLTLGVAPVLFGLASGLLGHE